MLKPQAKRAKECIAGLLPQRVLFAACLLPAMVLTAVGAPLSQMLRLAVVSSQHSEERTQYQVVFAAGIEEATARKPLPQVQANPEESERHEEAPRLLKPVSDIWETGSRVEFSVADVPLALEPAASSAADAVNHPEFSHQLYRNHSPPLPPSRGPPASA